MPQSARGVRRHSSPRRRRGAIVVLVLFLLVALLAMAAFAVDVSYMQLTRSQLRRATDAAARAAGEAIHRTADPDAARAAAKNAARQNLVAGQPLTLRDSQIVFGNTAQAKNGKWYFTPGATPFNGVQIRSARDTASQDGPVSLFFGRFLGTGFFEPQSQTTVGRGEAPRDFALVIDRSGSMNWSAAGGGGQSRWTVLKASLAGFFDALEESNDDEPVGLASYSSSSRVDQWLDNDYPGTMNIVEEIEPNGTTNINSGIIDGTSILSDAKRHRPKARKVMVVMTDGRHNTGPEPILAAEAAADEDIVIYTITFGNNADIARMQAVADATGGSHYHAPTASALLDVFRQVVLDSAEMVFVQ